MVNKINYYTSSIYIVLLGEQNLIIDLDKHYPTLINYKTSNFRKDVANLLLGTLI